ncbi:hypothetical protein F7725_004228 [Dissostichus mawsoni]|uniref:C2H2-type domain-containing protein n=1 Tax=Dissostichus mawsoni TaxID=36200 RepID=A0A7J5XI76_DISMA|nr:hypothetical protein F7725_004228 [Dissostichus mawsoni]
MGPDLEYGLESWPCIFQKPSGGSADLPRPGNQLLSQGLQATSWRASFNAASLPRLDEALYQVDDSHRSFVCEDVNCKKQCTDLQDLLAHLKVHMSKNELVHCPFNNSGGWMCQRRRV